MSNKIFAVVKRPGKAAESVMICNELEEFQKLVGGVYRDAHARHRSGDHIKRGGAAAWSSAQLQPLRAGSGRQRCICSGKGRRVCIGSFRGLSVPAVSGFEGVNVC